MPELAEVDYFRKVWNPGLKHCVGAVEIHEKKRIFRGIDARRFIKSLVGAKLERSESRGKQMLFVAKKDRAKEHVWLGIHLGMTGELRIEKPGFRTRQARSPCSPASQARAGV